LPGLIAGHYTNDEMHFDLRALARFAGARFVTAEVTGLDLAQQRILLADRAPLGFDLLSINAGITPALTDLQLAGGAVTPVKPIDAFQVRWTALQTKVLAASRPLRIAVVGGGAGGVELALAVSHRLRQDFGARGGPRPFELSLFSASTGLLPTHGAPAARYLAEALAAQGIRVQLNTRIVKALPATLEAADGRQFAIDETLWVTHAAPAPWLAADLGAQMHAARAGEAQDAAMGQQAAGEIDILVPGIGRQGFVEAQRVLADRRHAEGHVAAIAVEMWCHCQRV
jgi:selenide,water dikinase